MQSTELFIIKESKVGKTLNSQMSSGLAAKLFFFFDPNQLPKSMSVTEF